MPPLKPPRVKRRRHLCVKIEEAVRPGAIVATPEPIQREKQMDVERPAAVPGDQTWGVPNGVDKRARNDATQRAARRRKLNDDEGHGPIYAAHFSKEEIESQEKKPKRKVAVMIGYSGSGNHHEKTIEGDLFSAFVAAGAISKANGDDPKKSSLIRCARTDKGVHAAGNLISLKLIIEDPDIVQKINEKLTPQIRVFGIERTNGSFSAYQFCDSRIYEYLIPTHAFLPPHPDSFLGKKLVELAEEANDLEGYQNRQRDVLNFWEETEEHYFKPILEPLDPSIRPAIPRALFELEANHSHGVMSADSLDQVESETTLQHFKDSVLGLDELATDGANRQSGASKTEEPDQRPVNAENAQPTRKLKEDGTIEDRQDTSDQLGNSVPKHTDPSPLDIAIKKLRAQCIAAKKAYRIHPDRLARVRSSLSLFLGSQNYHNYTVNKDFRSASAKRVIKSFVVHDQPILINGTEWLSLKVHGQSFMMHQIRKMVSMVALVVRCGCHEARLQDSFMKERLSIPKAPGLGLLLERPVFDTYNERLVGQYGREKIDFGKFEGVMEEFKQREIYARIFREEERDNSFHTFFSSIDNFKSSQFLYLSSVGLPAARRPISARPDLEPNNIINDSSSDEDAADGEEG
ncbi:tRNA pseudouridine synthase 1 [Pseudocyphellaria aurata]|nr:tRNA pseudouridine synthase 1 [Pseudocyphellaria aurata]